MRPALVVLASWRPATGFTRVLAEIATRLGASYDVQYVGLGYKGDVQVLDGFTLHPCNLKGGDVYGAEAAAMLIDQLDAHVLLAVNDFWILQNYTRIIQPRSRRLRSIAYVPIDGIVTDHALVEPLSAFDDVVAYTEFGREQLEPAIGGRTRLHVIPHGVRTDTFQPLATGRSAARETALPVQQDPTWRDAFVVLNANRPVPRKRLDLTMEGFAIFANRTYVDVRLVLHHAISMPEELERTRTQIAACGIADRTWLSANRSLSDADLNLLYNACDVGINTSMGEGWGLISFEHAATGAPQIVTDFGPCAELWRGSAVMLPAREPEVPTWSKLAMAASSPDAVADALQKLYDDTCYRRAMADAALANTQSAAHAWDSIADRFEAVIKEPGPG